MMFPSKILLNIVSRRFVPKVLFPKYSTHGSKFIDILGSNNVKTEDLDVYNTDWLGSYKGLLLF